MDKHILLDVLQRILVNAHIAKNFIEDGKEIFCGRKIDAMIDQLEKLRVFVATSDRAEASASTDTISAA